MKKSLPAKKAAPVKKKKWQLILYIAGQTPRSIIALNNLKKICDEHYAGVYHLQIIDLLKHPELAKKNQIIAIPTLMRTLPKPVKKSIGDLSKIEQVVASLEVTK